MDAKHLQHTELVCGELQGECKFCKQFFYTNDEWENHECNEMNTKERCFEKVRRHFNNDAMAQTWWFESNHMLGGISPYDMCKMKRADKLERVIDAWIGENNG